MKTTAVEVDTSEPNENCPVREEIEAVCENCEKACEYHPEYCLCKNCELKLAGKGGAS